MKVFSCIKTQQNKSRITHDIVNILSQICCFYISKLNFAFEMSNIFRNTFEDDLYLTLSQGTTLSSKTKLNQVNGKIETQFHTFVSVVFLYAVAIQEVQMIKLRHHLHESVNLLQASFFNNPSI